MYTGTVVSDDQLDQQLDREKESERDSKMLAPPQATSWGADCNGHDVFGIFRRSGRKRVGSTRHGWRGGDVHFLGARAVDGVGNAT